MANTALPLLFQKAFTIDLNSRHGSVLAIGEIVKSLSTIAQSEEKNLTDFISEDSLKQCEDLIPLFQERLYFRGMGGELMKQACSNFIENCALAKLPVHGKNITGKINSRH